MSKKNDSFDSRAYVIKTALTPEQFAEYLGCEADFIGSDATRAHVLFMSRADFDADYRRRMEDLCERLAEVNAHVKSGNITPEAESSVAWCLRWAMDQMELMAAEQKKLVSWLMEANAEVTTLRNAERGAKGGSVAAAKTKEVKERAESLARERAPAGGWQSAPQAAEAILPDLRAFARERGRNPSARKVAEWLRVAGIKKGGRT
jgi:hypothetical protein